MPIYSNGMYANGQFVTVNQELPITDAIEDGDKFALYRYKAGQNLNVTAFTLAQYIDNYISNTNTASSNLISQVVSVTANATTVTVTDDAGRDVWLKVLPNALWSSMTIKMPSANNAKEGQVITVYLSRGVNAITWDGNGATMVNTPTYCNDASVFVFRYYSGAQNWICEQFQDDYITIVPTFADLAGVVGSVAYIQGFSSNGDGGQGFFRWNTGATTNYTGMQINSTNGFWSRIYDKLYPEYFGAKGDGVTNDFTAFSNAIAFVNGLAVAQNNTIPLPSICLRGKDYHIRSPLVVYPYIRIVTEGHAILDFSGVTENPSFSITSITRTGTVATVTTSSAHGLVAGDSVKITGAGQNYNGIQHVMTTPLSTTFTFDCDEALVTPATGTLTGQKLINCLEIRDSATGTPTTRSGRGIANLGYVLQGINGNIWIRGGTAPDSAKVGVFVGNLSSFSGKDVADCGLKNVGISFFGIGLAVGRFNTYINTFETCKIADCRRGVVFIGGSGSASVNSGERYRIVDSVVGGSGQNANNDFFDSTAIWIARDSMSVFIESTSLDFNDIPILLSSNARFSQIVLNDCHVEGWNNGVVYSFLDQAGGNTTQVSIDNTRFRPVYGSVFRPSYAPSGGGGSACQYEFNGWMSLTIGDNFNWAGYGAPSMRASDASFLCDQKVQMRKRFFTNWKNQTSKSLTLNPNPDFNLSTLSQNLKTLPDIGWFLRDSGDFSDWTVTIDNTQTFDGSARSLKIDSAGTVTPSDYIVLQSTPFPVVSGDRLLHQAVIYGGTTTGLVRIALGLVFFAPYARAQRPVTTLTAGATAVTATCAGGLPTNLAKGDFGELIGATTKPSYNKQFCINSVSGTQFTYVNTGTETGADAVSGTQVAFSNYRQLSVTSDYVIDFANVYGNTADPVYTGLRNFWAKGQNATGGQQEYTTRLVPAGASCASLVVTISQMNPNETFWLGYAGVTVL